MSEVIFRDVRAADVETAAEAEDREPVGPNRRASATAGRSKR